MRSLFTLAPVDLDDVDPGQSVEIFRHLLWGHARMYGVPLTKVHISSHVTMPDGGVDAKIDEDILDVLRDLLVSAGTCFQLKTGTGFQPWQPSQLRKELFGATTAEVSAENLGSAVRKCLEGGGRYIVVCFGIDPTSPQLDSAKKTLINYFEQCGFRDPHVDVWGQTHLVGLISKFPSLVLKILGRAEYQFQTLSSWAANDDMTSVLELGPAQETWIEEIRDALRTTNNHLRVIGEPGIGKTRLVLEALSADDLAPNMIYIPHAEDFQTSQFFNELLRPDLEYHVILVIDECPAREKASIWNALKSRRSQIQLITIDHGPDNSFDDATRVLHCPPLGNEKIAAIINSYVGSEWEARRWAPWCSGSPRVAHAVGQNLQANPDDLLRDFATVPIWERFVAGYDEVESIASQQRWVVLRHIALFQKFGFESPVSDEGQFIAKLIAQVDPTITWGRFQSIVEDLRSRRILQGKTTLFIVPKALHTYLWLDYWKKYGRGFDLGDFIDELPEGLHGWFTQMFIYAHADPRAAQVVRNFLAPGGPYDDPEFAMSPLGTHFLSVLAEANPTATLRCIQRIYGSWSKERLRSWQTDRHHIVQALEKIAMWGDTFDGAARILLKMGVTETSNHASGVFCRLFSLRYGPIASTATPPLQRMPVLTEALTSNNADERLLSIQACEIALSVRNGYRVIGAEYQGLKPTIELWIPETYGELFDAYRAVWGLLFDVSRNWPDDERKVANSVLIQAASQLLTIGSLAPDLMTTVGNLADDPATDVRGIIRFIVETRLFRSDNLSEEILTGVDALDAKIAGSTLEQQVDRYVINSSWPEEKAADTYEEGSLEKRVEELVDRAMNNPEEFSRLFAKLTRTDGYKLGQFAFEVGRRDEERRFLQQILEAQRVAGANGNGEFVSGYLRAVREMNEDEWETIVTEILSDDRLAQIVGLLVWRTGLNTTIAKQLIHAYSVGTVGPGIFTALKLPRHFEQIDSAMMEEILSVLLQEGDKDTLLVAIDIAESFYCRQDVAVELSDELIFELLTSIEPSALSVGSMPNYYWGRLATKYIDIYPARTLELFRWTMACLGDWPIAGAKSVSRVHTLAEKIAKHQPEEAWTIVADLLGDLDTDMSFGLLQWLEEEVSFDDEPRERPLTYFPVNAVLDWIEEKPDMRALAIARVAPTTLDKEGDGRITWELMERYGAIKSIRSELFANFFTDAWSGFASIHYREKRDQARGWLEGETSSNVVQWLREYIDRLNEHIEREEISEERELL